MTLREQIEHDAKLFAAMSERDRRICAAELRSCFSPPQPWWSPRY